MKALFLAISLLGNSLAADESTAFGLVGDVSVARARISMDVDSVSVTLQDARGGTLRVHYASGLWTRRTPYAGHFLISFPRVEGSYVVRYRSKEEQSLLILLRAACINTFGTADERALREQFAGDWTARSMSVLFRQEIIRPTWDEHLKENLKE